MEPVRGVGRAVAGFLGRRLEGEQLAARVQARDAAAELQVGPNLAALRAQHPGREQVGPLEPPVLFVLVWLRHGHPGEADPHTEPPGAPVAEEVEVAGDRLLQHVAEVTAGASCPQRGGQAPAGPRLRRVLGHGRGGHEHGHRRRAGPERSCALLSASFGRHGKYESHHGRRRNGTKVQLGTPGTRKVGDSTQSMRRCFRRSAATARATSSTSCCADLGFLVWVTPDQTSLSSLIE